MKSKKRILLQNIEIVDIGAEGKAIARVSMPNAEKEKKLIVFIHNAVPGDIVDVQLTRRQRNFAEGNPVHFHKYSDIRV